MTPKVSNFSITMGKTHGQKKSIPFLSRAGFQFGKGIVLREVGNEFIFYHRGTEVTEFPQRFILKRLDRN
jgi:hypothetical protein